MADSRGILDATRDCRVFRGSARDGSGVLPGRGIQVMAVSLMRAIEWIQ